jgi:hypothetical protein
VWVGNAKQTIFYGWPECPVNLMLGPVIHTPLLDRMSIQLQFTLEDYHPEMNVHKCVCTALVAEMVFFSQLIKICTTIIK